MLKYGEIVEKGWQCVEVVKEGPFQITVVTWINILSPA